MVSKIRKDLNDISKLDSPIEVRNILIALFRIVLQHANISITEWVIEKRKISSEKSVASIGLPIDDLRTPSDGTLQRTLSELMVIAENEGWHQVSRAYWTSVSSSRPCTRLLQSGARLSCERIIGRIIEIRNNGAEGHGIPGDYDPEAEIDAISFILDSLQHVLPKISKNDSLVIKAPTTGELRLRLLKAPRGRLVCYRSISYSRTSRTTVKAQLQSSLFDREDLVFETDNVLQAPQDVSCPNYLITETSDSHWKPLVLLPDRSTNQFMGRDHELAALADWADDTGSRACMVFGDGGVGKTTLVIEFVHRLLEQKAECSWKPELITFYTAKQTRWGANGLERLQVHDVGVADVAISLARGFEGPVLDKEWFAKGDPLNLISKLGGYMNEYGIRRDTHLLILDNTETMASNEEDARALAKQIQELSKRVGRVLVTSRRREQIEANPIELNTWDVDTSYSYILARANMLSIRPLLVAGDSTIRKYAKQMGCKPLVLEVFVQATQNLSSARAASEKVIFMQRQDLGEFLYDDAWKRLSDSAKHLMLLMASISDIHDDMLMKLCCQRCGVSLADAYTAFQESPGIGSITRINGRDQLAFSPEFLRYCEGRSVTIGQQICPTSSSINEINRKYLEILRAQSSLVRNRLALAYRHPYARAAWSAWQSGNYFECEQHLEEAIKFDHGNGWLFDQYAQFLVKMLRLSEAKAKSTRATEILPKDADVWFTLGMIDSRMHNIRESLVSINRAKQLGKEEYLCCLQEAHAYINDTPPDIPKARRSLAEAERLMPPNDPKRGKMLVAMRKLESRIIDIEVLGPKA